LLKKGLLTSEYESEQMVADRVTKAVQNAYAPAVNLAKIVESNQQRTKSIEVTARNTQIQANLLKEQLEKAKKGANELIHIIARGGEQLLQFQEEFRKGLEKSAEQDRQHKIDRNPGRSR
jgi:pantothenate kinase